MECKSRLSKSKPSKYMQFPPNQRRSIPYPRGSYTTGCADVLIGRDVDGSLMRLFYPTDVEDIRSEPYETWTPWYIGDPYIKGACLSKFYATFLSSALNVVYHWFLLRVFKSMFGKSLIPAIWEAPITSCKKPIPVIIFSHGISANRSAYSAFCNDIASNGFFVVAVEHRDESAGATFTLTSEGKKKWMIYRRIKDEQGIQTRNNQVKIRADECSRAMDILHKLNRGILVTNLLSSSFELSSLKDKLDLSNVCIAGQSFGGATVIETLGRDKRFHSGIALDPWMIPLVSDAKALSLKIKKPILFILMEQFQTEKNMDYIKLFNNERNRFYTIKRAIHENQVDTAIILAQELAITRKILDVHTSRFSAEVPLAINNSLVLKFVLTLLGTEPKNLQDLETFLESEEKHILKGIHGTGKSMLEWSSCNLPSPSHS